LPALRVEMWLEGAGHVGKCVGAVFRGEHLEVFGSLDRNLMLGVMGAMGDDDVGWPRIW
jgi:hypothetical protein